MADDNCFETKCKVQPKFSVLLVAPCNTIQWVSDPVRKKLVPVITQDILDNMYRLLICGTLEYTPTFSEEEELKIGGCGATDCENEFENYSWTGPVQYCPGDCVIESLVHPTDSCRFDYIYLPYPDNCSAVTIDDVMWVGAGLTSPTSFSFDPRAATGVRPDLTFKGCDRPLCILNNCADSGDVWTIGDGGAAGNTAAGVLASNAGNKKSAAKDAPQALAA